MVLIEDKIIIDYECITKSATALEGITIDKETVPNIAQELKTIETEHDGLELNTQALNETAENLTNVDTKIKNLGVNLTGVVKAFKEAEGDIAEYIKKIDPKIIIGDIKKEDIITDKTQYRGNTQASEFAELGKNAYNESGPITNGSAREQWIEMVGELVKKANKSGIKNSLVIAQIINESGWMNPYSERAKALLDMNNVIGINYDLDFDISTQNSSWSKNPRKKTVTVVQGWDAHDSNEEMRAYDSLEEAIEDYCDMVVTKHPYLKGSNNIDDYKKFLNGYTPYCNHEGGATGKYKEIISNYGLEKYDV